MSASESKTHMPARKRRRIGDDGGELNAGEELTQYSTSTALINNLNYDCLAKIFKYLPLGQRLEIETVCKHWKEALQLAWDDRTALKFDTGVFSIATGDLKDLPCSLKNTRGVGRILMRCGAHLRKLQIGEPCRCIILSIVAQYCSNLRELVLNFNHYDGDCKPCSFISVFRDLHDLRHLKLEYFHLHHSMMEAISEKLELTDLILDYCKISGELTLLLRLENLQHLELRNLSPELRNLSPDHVLDDDFVIQLADSCKHLKILALTESDEITDSGITALQKLTLLEDLNLMSDQTFSGDTLGGLINLKKLECYGCTNLEDDGIIELIKNAPKLQRLGLGSTYVTEAVIVAAFEVTRMRDSPPLEIGIPEYLGLERDEDDYQACSPLLKITYDC